MAGAAVSVSGVLDRPAAPEVAPALGLLDGVARPGSRSRRGLAVLERAGVAVLALQLVVLLVVSTVQYQRFALGQDFAGYSQAWWKIAHLHVDPWSTVFTTSFWRNDGEFLMWPLALLYHLFPNPVQLLWVQDLVAVGTELVAFLWVLDVVARSPDGVGERRRRLVAAGALAALVLNPWFYEAVAYDFHFEILVGLFTVLLGRDLWAGRYRRLWWWAALALLSHDLAGGLCVLGVGVSGALAGRRTRRRGLLLAGVGLSWIAWTSAVGAAGLGGRLERQGYGYLTGAHGSGPLAVLLGVPHHLPALAHLLAGRWPLVVALLASAAFVGIVSPWAAGVTLVVLAPAVLNADPTFLFLSFQNWPILPFVLVGSAMVLLRLADPARHHRRARRVAVVSWAVCAVALTAALGLPDIARIWITIPPAQSAVLARADTRIPADAEVVATVGVVGRFAERDQVYPFPFEYHPSGSGSLTFPVARPKMVFVFVDRGRARPPARYTTASIAYVTRTLHAATLVSSSGVGVYLWTPPRGTTRVTLPAPS